jgi:pimeloyl-ACP methyl ester carboxylesterase
MKNIFLFTILAIQLTFAQATFKSEEVNYWNQADSVHIFGTLTMPENGSMFPAVILITGSGTQDRDETILGHKPFKVIAEYLTNNGIAVLRVDDRGAGKTTLGKNIKTVTSENFAEDVKSGIKYLKTRNEINHKKIGLIGHSEGGMIASMVAAQSQDISFIVSLAGTGVSGEIILQKQLTIPIESIPNFSTTFKQKYALYIASVLNAYKQAETQTVAVLSLDKITKNWKDSLSPEDTKYASNLANVYYTLKKLAIDWGRFFIKFDPKTAISKVKCPILVLNGSKDHQVFPEENLSNIEEGLKIAKNKHYKIIKLEGLNHLFQHAETGLPQEYAKIKEDFAPEALQIMSDWLIKINK